MVLLYLLLCEICTAFNENLNAKHYSIVDAGIDDEIFARALQYQCEDCSYENEGQNVNIKVSHEETKPFRVTTVIPIEDYQNIRVEFAVEDFISNILHDSSSSQFFLDITLEYSDGEVVPVYNFDCKLKCVEGSFSGSIDLSNELSKKDIVKVHFAGQMFNMDLFTLKSFSVGDLILRSKIYEDAKGIVGDSCEGQMTGTVLFGNAGVGKSTVASLISSKPGLFEVGSSNHGTTTLGTWLSSSIGDGNYSQFADHTFQPLDNMPDNIEQLEMLTDFYDNQTNIAFMDTEGMGYQTEYGQNYDTVTILPHTIIAENVFLVVVNRLNPEDVRTMIQRLADSAQNVQGTLPHRGEKLFGKFTIVVNKAQDISLSDEEELEQLKIENPSLITTINEYFTHGPYVVVLPALQWDYDAKPNFDEEGFYLTYDHVNTAHPNLRDRMFYGLHKLASLVVWGVPSRFDYSINCENFESMLETLYKLTTEDIIDLDDINYDWLLHDAKIQLEQLVSSFKITSVGLSSDVLTSVCPQSDDRLKECIKNSVALAVEGQRELWLEEIINIFPKGYDDLVAFLDDFLIPTYVNDPIIIWFNLCEKAYEYDENYTESFLEVFEKSMFFKRCQAELNGLWFWNPWRKCSQGCSTDRSCGTQMRIADHCEPSYSTCSGLPVQEQECGCEKCDYQTEGIDLPVGSILPWVNRPNILVPSGVAVDYKSWKGWIKCDGKEFCSDGPFKNHVCEDLNGRTLVGATKRANEDSLRTNEATMPNIVHKHTQEEHQHTVRTSMSGNHHACQNGNNQCASTDRGGDTYSTTAAAPTIKFNPENDLDAYPVSYNYDHSFGDLYSRHMRVDFIFKCY